MVRTRVGRARAWEVEEEEEDAVVGSVSVRWRGGVGNEVTFGERMSEWHGACKDQSDQGEGEESEGQGTTKVVFEILEQRDGSFD